MEQALAAPAPPRFFGRSDELYPVWTGLSFVASVWLLFQGVPFWIVSAGLACVNLPALGFALASRTGALSQIEELENCLWLAAAVVCVGVTGAVVSPLALLFAAPAVIAASRGGWSRVVEAALLAAIAYSLACLAVMGVPTSFSASSAAGLTADAFGTAFVCLLAVSAGAAIFERLRRLRPAAAAVTAPVPPPVTRPAADELRSQLERARSEADAARAALESRTRFFAQTSHELRTPLNAIIGFADLMKNQVFGPLPQTYQEYAELIQEGGRSLEMVVDDVLDLARIEAGRYDIAPDFISLTDHCAEAIRFMSDIARRKSITLEMASDDEDIEGYADPRAVRQIALNLISNSLKFTPAGGRVTVTALPADNGALIAVSDTGVGISPEDLRRLSMAFEQAEEGRRHKGAGLGLSVVRAFAELHGGRLDIESRVGGGSTIAVFFPDQVA
jgi:signal transduction histidine kinase